LYKPPRAYVIWLRRSPGRLSFSYKPPPHYALRSQASLVDLPEPGSPPANFAYPAPVPLPFLSLASPQYSIFVSARFFLLRERCCYPTTRLFGPPGPSSALPLPIRQGGIFWLGFFSLEFRRVGCYPSCFARHTASFIALVTACAVQNWDGSWTDYPSSGTRWHFFLYRHQPRESIALF
jgi:hypothetical protein